MNKTIKYFNILLLISLSTFWSCEEDELGKEINSTILETFGKLEIIHGDKQSGFFGEFLSDSIIVKASSNSLNRRYLIKYEMLKGNGEIERGDSNKYWDDFNIDSTGIFQLNWRLGCNFNIQKLKLTVHVDSTKNYYGDYIYYNMPSDSIIITANAIKPKGWIKSCGTGSLYFSDSKIISYENTLYLVGRGLYSSTDQGLNWKKIEGIPISDSDKIINAQFNSQGWLYITTENLGVCYTKDLQNWEFINNGILDHRTPTTFLVEDSTLFVSFYFDGPYKSTDNGKSWNKMFVSNNADRFYHITRHPNGDIYLFDKWGILWKSKDSGNSWKKVDIEYKYVDSPIYDLEIDNSGDIYIGADDASISKVSSETYTGELHTYYEMNNSSQSVEKIREINNVIYFTVNGNPRPGVYSNQNWEKIELDFDKPILDYFLKKDGTFLLLSNDRVYYFN